jgi:hypothetical protein
MEDNKRKKSVKNRLSVKRMALVTLSAGCLTFLVAGLALAGGLLLDARLETFPRWTLILLAGSAPITLGGVYFIVRRTLQRMKGEGDGVEQ